MIVLNAGVPRSGTVLVNAILRGLLDGWRLGYAHANPHGPELPALLARLSRSGEMHLRTTLIHTHSWDGDSAALLRGSPHVRTIANYRDPRDVCVSLMHLHEHDFDTAARMVAGAFAQFEATCRDLPTLVVPYELLIAHKPAWIFQIGRTLGLWPGPDTIARIDAATTLSRHRAVMEDVQAGRIDGVRARQNRHRILREDPATLINDRHIQSGTAGRWKQDLTADQQAAATETFAPLLRRYGYA